MIGLADQSPLPPGRRAWVVWVVGVALGVTCGVTADAEVDQRGNEPLTAQQAAGPVGLTAGAACAIDRERTTVMAAGMSPDHEATADRH